MLNFIENEESLANNEIPLPNLLSVMFCALTISDKMNEKAKKKANTMLVTLCMNLRSVAFNKEEPQC